MYLGYRAIVGHRKIQWHLSLRSQPPFTGAPRGRGLKVPHGVLFERFWAIASECPKECFLSVFWRSTSTPWGTFSPGPWAPLLHGGWNRKPIMLRYSGPPGEEPELPQKSSSVLQTHHAKSQPSFCSSQCLKVPHFAWKLSKVPESAPIGPLITEHQNKEKNVLDKSLALY